MTAKSVAVLAFFNLGGDKDDEYFAEGISDELLNVLGKVPGLRVAARPSAFSFKGKSDTAQEIGQKLGVAHLVDGSVRRAGTRVRIAARLSRSETGEQLWSKTYDNELKDIFALQDEIARDIAQNLQLKLGDTSRSAIPVNPEAYRLVLEGRHFLLLRTYEDFVRAETAFKKAIALDPEFPPAHAGLSELCVVRASYTTQDGARFDSREVQADLRLGRAEAERQFEKALALNPNFLMAHAWLGVMRGSQGRLDDSLRSFEKTAELDPLWAVNLSTYSEYLFYAGRFAEVLQISDRVMALRPDIYIPNLGFRARALLALGRNDEAVETARFLRKHLDRKPRREADGSAIWVLRRAGLPQEAGAYAEDWFKILPDQSHQRGFALGAMGRFDEALPLLEGTPPVQLRRLYWDPMWDPWRDDPRFDQLMAKLGCTAEYRVARATLARILKEQGVKK